MAVGQLAYALTDPLLSGASPLAHWMFRSLGLGDLPERHQGCMKYKLEVEPSIFLALLFFRYALNSRSRDSLLVYFLYLRGVSHAYIYNRQESKPSTLSSGP